MCCATIRRISPTASPAAAGRAAPPSSIAPQWTTQVTGAPRVLDALVAFDCRVTASERVGSHFVVFGSVQDIFVAGGGAPLIYANRAYGVPRRFHQRAIGAEAPRRPRRSRIGCYQVFAPYMVPALVARLTKLHPGIGADAGGGGSGPPDRQPAPQRHRGGAAVRLRSGRCDLQLTPLAELTPYVLLPEGHPLAAAPGIALEELVNEPLVLLDVEPSRDYFLSLFRDAGLEPHIGYRTRSLEMVRGLVGHGLGYSLLATKPANNMTYDGRALVARPLTNAGQQQPPGAGQPGRPDH